MSDPIDRAIDGCARRHGGFIHRQELIALGLSARQITYRIKIGRLIPVHRGVYAVGHLPRLAIDRAHGVLLACGPTSALSHRSAASLWRYYRDWWFPLEVTATADRRPRGITVHTSTTLTAADIRIELGLRTTSRERTILDLAPRLNDWQLRRLIDDASNDHHLRRQDLYALTVRLPHAPSAGRIRTMLTGGHNPTRSDLEALFRDVHARRNLPRALFNVVVDGVEVDVYFPEYGLIVELDGYRFHSSPRVFESDRSRDRSHLRQGKPTVRLTWYSMTHDPDRDADLLADILEGMGRRAA